MIFTLLFYNTYDREEKPALRKAELNDVELQTGLKESFAQHPETYGAVALVDVSGQVDGQSTIGWQKTSEKLVMNTDSMLVFSGLIQSMLTTIALQFAEEGYFLLADPVHNYLSPDLLNLLPERHRHERRFRHLLNHSSGLFDALQEKWE